MPMSNPKRVPLVRKMVGDVPYRTVTQGNDKGRFISSTKIGDTSYTAEGATEKQALLELQKQLRKL